MREKEAPETAPDSPLPDLSDAAVKKLTHSAKKRGYVTHDQINLVLPSEEVNSQEIEDVLADETEVIEPDERRQRNGKDELTEPEMQNEGGEIVELKRPAPAKGKSSELSARTDDPVRMYLREMGSVELLSREGEIAIAKRVEAGREAMIAGCARARSPSRPSSFGATSSTRARFSCATSSIWKRPMPGPTPRPCRRR